MNAAKSRFLPKVDNRSKFRSFIIAYHKKYGYLLLRSYKPQKGLHFQLPGGHIDKTELRNDSLAHASLIAAQRELYEETGLNIDEKRLKPINLGIKNRLYFELLLTDADSLQPLVPMTVDDEEEEVKMNLLLKNKLIPSLNETQDTFFIQLSHEHNAWQFELDIYKASDLVKFHSAGKNAKALKLYAQRARHEKKKAKKLLKKQLKAEKKRKKSAISSVVVDDVMVEKVVVLNGEVDEGQALNSNRYISVDHVDDRYGSPMSSSVLIVQKREKSNVQIVESNDDEVRAVM